MLAFASLLFTDNVVRYPPRKRRAHHNNLVYITPYVPTIVPQKNKKAWKEHRAQGTPSLILQAVSEILHLGTPLRDR